MNFLRTVKALLPDGKVQGKEYHCLCPFHSESKPSFTINVQNGKWHCFGCHEGGGFATLCKKMGYSNFQFRELTQIQKQGTLEEVKERLQEIKTSRIKPINQTKLAENYHRISHPYLKKRGFKATVLDQFLLGYDLGTDSVTIPYREASGRVTAIIRRCLGKGVKYIYPHGFAKKEAMFALDQIKGYEIVLVEGSLDAIWLHQQGFPGVAMLGSSFSEEQNNLLTSQGVRKVYVLMDNDEAGNTALPQVISKLKGKIVYACLYPDGLEGYDPCNLTSQQIGDILQNSSLIRSKKL